MLNCDGFLFKFNRGNTKPALTFEQQAQKLINRGLIAPSQETLISYLKSVNYYRLSAYWYTFKTLDPQTNEEFFVPHTNLETIWERYVFDRNLRLLIMDAIEHIEVTIFRTRMVELFTVLYGPFGYIDRQNFNPSFSVKNHTNLLNDLNKSVLRSKEEFVERYRKKYSDEPYLPLWMAAEIMSFGQLYTFFRNLHRSEKQVLSKQFDLYPPVFESWLHTLNFIRNTCAHHNRLWNREIPIRPLIPNKKHNPEWHTELAYDHKRLFTTLTLIQYLLQKIDSTNTWKDRLFSLIANYPNIPIHWMGFPENWKTSLIWKE